MQDRPCSEQLNLKAWGDAVNDKKKREKNEHAIENDVEMFSTE